MGGRGRKYYMNEAEPQIVKQRSGGLPCEWIWLLRVELGASIDWAGMMLDGPSAKTGVRNGVTCSGYEASSQMG